MHNYPRYFFSVFSQQLELPDFTNLTRRFSVLSRLPEGYLTQRSLAGFSIRLVM